MFFTAVALIGFAILAGCHRQPSYVSEPQKQPILFEGGITRYLPITLGDQFELTSRWHYHNYPYGKTDFTEIEFNIVKRTISSFSFYGLNQPWGDEGRYGCPPILIATNEDYKTVINFIELDPWGTLALAQVNDGSWQWFTVGDADAFRELLVLLDGR